MVAFLLLPGRACTVLLGWLVACPPPLHAVVVLGLGIYVAVAGILFFFFFFFFSLRPPPT
jgi:hypothetical protein